MATLRSVPVRSLESLPECNYFCERQLGSFRRDGQCLDESGDVDLLALARATEGLVQIEAKVSDGVKLVLELLEAAMAYPAIDPDVPFCLCLWSSVDLEETHEALPSIVGGPKVRMWLHRHTAG
jgi:hypothetical protein